MQTVEDVGTFHRLFLSIVLLQLLWASFVKLQRVGLEYTSSNTWLCKP